MASQNFEQPVICVFCGSQSGESPEYLAAARALAHELHRSNVKLVYGGGTTGLMGELARTLVSLSGPSAVHGFIPKALISKQPGINIDSLQDVKQAERVVSADDFDRWQELNVPLAESDYGITTIVPDMHTRKRMMAQQVLAGGPGSGFVALPGGYGTLEEIAEITTWNQLGIHDKGIVLLNIDGFWDGLLIWLKKAVEQRLVGQGNKDIMVECTKVEDVVEALKTYKPSSGRLELSWDQE